MILRRILAVSFLFVLSFPAVAADKTFESAYDRVMKTGTIRCGIMVWPPYFVKDQNTGEVSGMARELNDAVAEIMGLKMEYVEIVIGQQVEELNRGRVDAICNEGPYTFTAMKYVDYTKPLFYAPVFVYVREAEDRFSAAQDLNREGVKFVGMDGDLSVTLAQRNFPKAILQTMPGTSVSAQLMLDVTTGKADATIMDPPSVRDFNANNKPGIRALEPDKPVAVYPIGLSVRKGETDLQNMLNYAVDALLNTGGIEPVLRRYDPAGEGFYSVTEPYKVPR